MNRARNRGCRDTAGRFIDTHDGGPDDKKGGGGGGQDMNILRF